MSDVQIGFVEEVANPNGTDFFEILEMLNSENCPQWLLDLQNLYFLRILGDISPHALLV